ncbi:hypothetical protein GCM10028791_03020 [Echinicola sediminis]
MKIVLISECQIREMAVIEQLLYHYPSTIVVSPNFSKGPKKKKSLTPSAVLSRLAKRTLVKLHLNTLNRKLYPDPQSKPSIQNRIEIHGPKLNQTEGITLLQELEPDVLITCRAPLLKPEIIKIPKIAAVNIHYGIAPAYRGNDSLFWALFFRDYEHLGGCIHHLSEGVDTGDILSEAFPALAPGDGETEIDIKTTRLLGTALIQYLKALENGEAKTNGKPQTQKGKNFKSADRTVGKSLLFWLKKNVGASRPPKREEKIITYF